MPVSICRLVCVAIMGVFLSAGPALAREWTVDGVLKEIDKSTGKVDSLTGEVSYSDQRSPDETVKLDGKVSIRMDGFIRFEGSGDDGKVVICAPDEMMEYDPAKRILTEIPLSKHPEKLAQYAQTGFSLRGAALKKDYLVTVLEEGDLDGHKIVRLELTPRSDKLRGLVSKIQLWIDQATWLPIQQQIFRGGADSNLKIRYKGIAMTGKLPKELFDPKWPKGTKKQKL